MIDAGDEGHVRDGSIEFCGYDDANQLVRVSSSVKDDWSYDHDGAGRMTRAFVDNDDNGVDDENEERRVYSYDPAGLLAEVTTTIATTEWVDTRTYGPDGILAGVNVVETGPDGPDEGSDPDVVDHTFDYVWDTVLAVPQPLQVASDQNEVFDATSTFVNGLGAVGGGTDRVSAHVRLHTETPVDLDFYLATDVHGSTIPTEGTAGFVRAAGYDEFGNPAGPVLNNPREPALGFRGEFQTVDTIHLRARTYIPWTARFTVPDPLDGVDGTPTVANGYHYGDNDPLSKIDPLGLRPNDGPCSGFRSTGALMGAQTCEAALDLWERRDRSPYDCDAVGGVTYGSGTCYVPPRSGVQMDFCFPPTSPNAEVVSLGPGNQCGVWSVEIGCARFSNSVTDWICRHRVGILKVSGYALIPAAIGVGAVTGGAAAGAVLAVTSASLQVSAEAFDGSPCRSQRITVSVMVTMLGGGVGGAFSEGGLIAGEAITEAGLVGLDRVEFTC